MTSPLEILHHWWDYYRERPFLRLFRIFTERVFRGGSDTDAEGLDLGVGLVLTLLALPGGFVSVLMFVKYSTFLSWMRGAPQVDPVAVAMPDEYFYIALSMAVTGTIAAWRWDALLPDRRDYMNLVPLPVSTRTISLANFAAISFLAVLTAFDVNAASSILFPLGVGATQSSFLFFVKFTAVHALVVGLASVFAFLAVLSLLGLLLAILPPHFFRKISPYVRTLVVMYFVTLISTAFAVPDLLSRNSPAPPWMSLLPSCWFVGLCQSLHGEVNPAVRSLARFALPGLASTAAAALGFYALGYRRHFLRIPEMSDTSSRRERARTIPLSTWFDRWILRTPFQRGCFHFVWRTLFRSEAHRLALAGIWGLGIVLASQSLAGAVQGVRAGESSPSASALAVPFVLSFFIIVGLRTVFEIPGDLSSNWIFRLTLDAEKHECRPLARTVLLTFVLPWLFVVSFPVYCYVDGWLVGALHTLLVSTWSVLLAHAALIRFRKLPFTCPLPVFQQNSIVNLLGWVLGFFVFAVLTPEAESWALSEPLRMVVFVIPAWLFWYIPRRMDQTAIEVEKGLIFEDAPTRAVQVLQLGD
jgi:hypothetical protein